MFVSVQFKLEFENKQDKANPAFTSVIVSLKYALHPSVSGKWQRRAGRLAPSRFGELCSGGILGG